MKMILAAAICAAVAFPLLSSCTRSRGADLGNCRLVPTGFGPEGTAPVRLETYVTGLEVPWQMVFPAPGEILVTERPGRIRLVRAGSLVQTPVARIPVLQTGGQGLLGIALDPFFGANSLIYVYYTFNKNGVPVNRVERYVLSSDHTRATPAGVILDDIPAANALNGGFLRFGPDRRLYVSVGEASDASRPENPASPNGKILRINPDGSISWFVRGVRNSEGFDWLDSATMLIAEGGPTGEYQGETGGDRIDVGRAGLNMGWPESWKCRVAPGATGPILTWNELLTPGAALFYRGNAIPEWTGSLLFATLYGAHLHRVVLGPSGVVRHEVYFQNLVGRLRDVEASPDGTLYVTSSNCDERGYCPPQKDGIFRVVPGRP